MTGDYLRHEEYVQEGQELSIGEQIHINHEDCPAGIDTKRRLYIKRGDDDGNDIIMAYCQHCGVGGSYSEHYSKAKGHHKKDKQSRTTISSNPPDDARHDWERWSVKAKAWVSRAGINNTTSKRWGITYSPSEDRVIIPMHHVDDGRLMGYQMRSLDPNDTPKYLTKRNESPLYWYSGKVSDTLVIVEDVLSGIRASKYDSALALLSSGLSDEVFAFIAESGHTNYIVYLDNDNRQVKKNQLDLKNRLEMLGKVVIIKSDRDPKELSDTELEEILDAKV